MQQLVAHKVGPFYLLPTVSSCMEVADTSPTLVALLSVMPQVCATKIFFKLVAYFFSCGMKISFDNILCCRGAAVGHCCVPLRSKDPPHRPLSLHVGDHNMKGAATCPYNNPTLGNILRKLQQQQQQSNWYGHNKLKARTYLIWNAFVFYMKQITK